ncbi:MAG: FtsX-like permease family protein [Anaerolineae bacterium]
MAALFRKAYRDVSKRRLRSLFTLAGIIIGVAGIVAIVSTGQNLARAQAAAYAHASQADLSFWVWDAPAATERAIAGVDNVATVELRQDWSTHCQWAPGITGLPVSRDALLHGVADFDRMRVDQIFLRTGRFPRAGEIVAEQSALDAAPLRIGDVVTCRARSGGPAKRLTVVGVVQSPNYLSAAILNYLTFYGTDSDVKALLGTAGSNSLLVKVGDFTRVSETANAVIQLLDRRGVAHDGGTIRDPQNYVGKRELDALLLLLLVFALVGLITSGFLVANTLSAIVAEQVGEIGAIKAIGGTRGQVLLIYLFAGGIYGMVGTLFGLILGTVLSWRLLAYIGSFLSLDASFMLDPAGLALGVLVGIGVTLVAGLIPAMTATLIPVKDALDSYGIGSTYGMGRVDRLVRRLVALPPLAAMSLRNLARRKARTLVTLFVIAVAVAGLLAAQSVSISVDSAIEDLFHVYRADAWVYFGEPVSTAFESALRGLPFVARVETWSFQDTWVMNPGRYGVTAAPARLVGLPSDTQLYAPSWVAGRWYRADETDAVVISSDLALAQDLRLGDPVQVDSGNDPRWFRVVGILVDNSVFLGSQVTGKVFLREDLVAMMQQRSGYATLFALAFDAHDSATVQNRLDQIAARWNRYSLSTDSAAGEVRSAREQTRILALALAAMSLLIGLLGALGVVNTLTLNVLERRRELGVLRAVGASDANLIQAFLAEGLALGFGGWLLGLLIGYPLGLALTRLMESVLFQIPYRFTPQMVLISLLLALILSASGSLVPALGAARLRVGEVLRYE